MRNGLGVFATTGRPLRNGACRDQPRHCKDRGMGGLRRTGWLRALEEWGGGGGAEGFGGGVWRGLEGIVVLKGGLRMG